MERTGKNGPKLVEWEGARPTPPFLRSAQGVRVFLLGTCAAFTAVFGLMIFTSAFKPLPPIEYVFGTLCLGFGALALWRLRRAGPRVAAKAASEWAAGEPSPTSRNALLAEWSELHLRGAQAMCGSVIFGGMASGFTGSLAFLVLAGTAPLLVGVCYFPRRREAEAIWYGPSRRDNGRHGVVG